MNISTTKEKFLRAILLAERLTGKKESLPVLSCVLLEAQEYFVVRATNLEAGIEITTPATISEKGTVAVPASILAQTIRSLSSDTITLTLEDGNLLISSKGTKTLIKAIPHNEFPSLGESNNTQKSSLAISKQKLLQGIESVVYATSQSMIRPELGSISISFQENNLVCVATDSFRLAEKNISYESQKESKHILLPLKHAHELAHLLDKIETDAVDVWVDDVQLQITGDGVRYISRVVDGNFPNYKDIIPKKFSTEVTLLKNDFAELLRKARVFAGEEQHIGFHLYPSRKICTATAQSNSIGEMSDTIDAALTGEDIDINFHIGYISECLSSIGVDSVTLGFSGIGRPLVIRGVSDASFTYLVMPLNR